MQHATLIVLLALLQYVYFIARVGQARGKYNVNAPATTGHEIFDRTYRVQQNTLEQLLIFIPSTLAFSFYVSDKWVLIPGVVYLLGRFLYSIAYVKDPSSRAIGFGMTIMSNAAMLLIALAFLLMKIF